MGILVHCTIHDRFMSDCKDCELEKWKAIAKRRKLHLHGNLDGELLPEEYE